MDQARTMAQTQIASLQSQVQATQAAPSRSFLDPANAWGNTPAVAPRPAAAPAVAPAVAPIMASAPAQMQPPVMQSAAPAASPGFFGGGAGSMLGTVAATAAGVAGGAFPFQGIQHLRRPNRGAGVVKQ